MKTIFDNDTRNEIINRIESLNLNSERQWGKMSVFQMCRHCALCEELYLGKRKVNRAFIGRIFGKLGLHRLLKNDAPFQHNQPTSPSFKVNEIQGDISSEKLKWIALIKEYENYNTPYFTHWFFGKMTKEQVGQFVFKHNDHHLRQFNV